MADPKPAKQEAIKESSEHLRGNIATELANEDLFVSNESYELLKFHGSYQGYDRDTATERKKAGLDKEHEFMLRLKLPGGRMSAAQYLAMDNLAEKYANSTLRITTRETFQFHCIVKHDLKPLIADINHNLLTTLGGCGDVVRNVNAPSAPLAKPAYKQLQADAEAIARHFSPRTEGYLDIWMDGEKVEGWGNAKSDETFAGNNADDPLEPIYGTHYLPRKFKIGLTIPEDNSLDVLTNDIAVFALYDGDDLHGYNIYVGGGLGMQHNNAKTYPRLASPLCFVTQPDLMSALEAIVKVQRDYGNRTNRRLARLKYVIDEHGTDWFKTKTEEYAGKIFANAKDMPPLHVPDWMGWHPQGDGKFFLGIPISSGRILDKNGLDHGEQIRTGLRSVIAKRHCPVILTADQNIILHDLDESDKDALESELRSFGIKLKADTSRISRNTLACVALPTCGKALAEAERIKLPLVDEMDGILSKLGLADKEISIRITGCPNGCARSFTGDIGLVGRTPDHYAIYIGGDFESTYLNEKVFDRIHLNHVPAALEEMLKDYATHGQADEGFGVYCQRAGVQTVAEHAKQRLITEFEYKKL